ncbi:MAG: Asp-tRNA(Asn)/Glu-tRNA(Gln) amidotransferase GatCAB subunit B, partial [Dehalococcoidales bacterium]|nr:Asp-tRNA(Asn)/Glu-tRNA(Gln) amidotransferase GatCAB subunit B [Dehalococcoidales bacterium]
SKEFAHDYRYFPEPDLPPIIISRDWVEEVRQKLPELAETRRDRFMADYGLPLYDANLLTDSKALADYFEACMDREPQSWNLKEHGKLVANWILGEFTRLLNATNTDVNKIISTAFEVSPNLLMSLLDYVKAGKINQLSAKAVLEEMFKTGKTAGDIIRERGLSQISDTGELEKIVAEVINSNVQPVADYKAGKETALKFLVGQVMKATRGQANPQIVNDVLKQKLAEA